MRVESGKWGRKGLTTEKARDGEKRTESKPSLTMHEKAMRKSDT